MFATLERIIHEVEGLDMEPVRRASDSDLVIWLKAIHRLEHMFAGLKILFVRDCGVRGLPAAGGHRTAAAWLRKELLLDPTPARELARAAAELQRFPAVEQSLCRGDLDARQAAAIVKAAGDIPSKLDDGQPTDPAVVERAEATLVEMAGRLPAYQLRRVGERILEHVAPGAADRASEEAARGRERRARRRRHFTMSLPEDGLVRLTGALTVDDAAVVQAALLPLSGPAADKPMTARERRADALVEVCNLAMRAGELPEQGGEPPQVVVTIPFDPIRAELGKGTLDNGSQVSAETARRMACDAKILPVLLGSEGQVLDVGRSRRLATGPLRRALVVRDRGCAFPNCDRPSRWCDAHHMIWWDKGGPTELDNLVLLCRHHHRLIHDETAGWHVELGADRIPDFFAPVWKDPLQTALRNEYHPRNLML